MIDHSISQGLNAVVRTARAYMFRPTWSSSSPSSSSFSSSSSSFSSSSSSSSSSYSSSSSSSSSSSFSLSSPSSPSCPCPRHPRRQPSDPSTISPQLLAGNPLATRHSTEIPSQRCLISTGQNKTPDPHPFQVYYAAFKWGGGWGVIFFYQKTHQVGCRFNPAQPPPKLPMRALQSDKDCHHSLQPSWTVDILLMEEILHQLRLVAYPIIYRIL